MEEEEEEDRDRCVSVRGFILHDRNTRNLLQMHSRVNASLSPLRPFFSKGFSLLPPLLSFAVPSLVLLPSPLRASLFVVVVVFFFSLLLLSR